MATNTIEFDSIAMDAVLISTVGWGEIDIFLLFLVNQLLCFKGQLFPATRINSEIEQYSLLINTFTFVIPHQIFQVLRRKYKFLLPFVPVMRLRLNLASMYNYVYKNVILANSTLSVRLQKLDASHLCGLYKNSFLFSDIILPFLTSLYNSLAICFRNFSSN